MDEFEMLFTGKQFRKLCEHKYEDLREKYALRQIELEILYFLGSASVMCVAREIVENWNVSKALVSKSIDHLREGGYLEVEISKEDHRLTELKLTALGKEVVREVGKRKKAVKEIMYQGVTEEEKEVLLKVAGKIRSNICTGLNQK